MQLFGLLPESPFQVELGRQLCHFRDEPLTFLGTNFNLEHDVSNASRLQYNQSNLTVHLLAGLLFPRIVFHVRILAKVKLRKINYGTTVGIFKIGTLNKILTFHTINRGLRID